MVDDQTPTRTSAKTTPPIVAARLACRAQRIELAKLAGQISGLRYASPAAHARMAESIDVAAAALLGLDRALRDLQAAQWPRKQQRMERPTTASPPKGSWQGEQHE